MVNPRQIGNSLTGFPWVVALGLLFSLLVACATVPSAAPPPTPSSLLIARPSALMGWDTKIYACAVDFPQLAVFVLHNKDASFGSLPPAIKLHLGSPQEPTPYSYIIAWEDLRLAANASFLADEITLQQLQELYAPENISSQSLDLSTTPNLPAWTYPEGDEARQVFDRSVLAGIASPPLALIAPDPSAMLEALARNPSAVGYLPASALSLASPEQSSQIKILTLKDQPAESFRQPVVAMLPAEPDSLLNAFLQCLQEIR